MSCCGGCHATCPCAVSTCTDLNWLATRRAEFTGESFEEARAAVLSVSRIPEHQAIKAAEAGASAVVEADGSGLRVLPGGAA